jgi:hypothetical protein
MADLQQIAFRRLLHQIRTTDRGHTLVTCHGVDVVAGKQNDLAGAKLNRRLAVDGEKHAPFQNDMIADHLHESGEEGRAGLRCDLRRHTPGRRESGVKEKTALEPDRPQHVR